MPRTFYCSKCGLELINRRKAFKNKMTIIDLIEPHNCEESSKANMTNITDLSTPNPNYSKGVLQVDPQPEGFHDKESIFQDRRAKEFLRKDSKLVTSTAPFGVLSQIEGTKTGHIPNRPIPSSSEESDVQDD